MTALEVRKPQLPANNGDMWDKFRHEMDRVFDRFTSGFEFAPFRGASNVEYFWPAAMPGMTAPAIDVSEDDKTYTVTAELPGIEKKDVDVHVSHGMLVIKGEKRQEKEEKNKNYTLNERSYGSFQRSFMLPENVNRDAISADFANGVLTIKVPKTAEAKDTKKIEVKAA